jgi:phospholipase/carboxylesterase
MTDFSLVHRTRPAAGGGPHPALLLLHGLGSNEMDLHMLATQLDPRLYAISARAPFGQPWSGYRWYDLAEGPGRGGLSIEASLDRLVRFLTEIAARYPVDPERLYVGGFSQGAAMAGALTLTEPELIAGTIMISGYLPPPAPSHPYNLAAAVGKPVFQAHGTGDPVVLPAWARQTRDFLRGVPVDLTYTEYAIGHEVSVEELADLAAWLDSRLEETWG